MRDYQQIINKYYPEDNELKRILMVHSRKVADKALEVAKKHPELHLDKAFLEEASMLHDLGKVLIPSKILNKPAKLNVRERKIMNIHSTLGYELLKTQGVSEDVLNLIKYHHQNWKHSGYPILTSESKASDLGVQIISIADKYSALREARVYRRRLSRIEALLVLYREVREGKILPEVYQALVKYAEKYDS
jgi:putative nucleotidyltransferase with HDIG domain